MSEELINLKGRAFFGTEGGANVAFTVEETNGVGYTGDLDVYFKLVGSDDMVSFYRNIYDEKSLKETIDVYNKIAEAASLVAQSIEAFGRKTFPELYVAPVTAEIPVTTEEDEAFKAREGKEL